MSVQADVIYYNDHVKKISLRKEVDRNVKKNARSYTKDGWVVAPIPGYQIFDANSFSQELAKDPTSAITIIKNYLQPQESKRQYTESNIKSFIENQKDTVEELNVESQPQPRQRAGRRSTIKEEDTANKNIPADVDIDSDIDTDL